jgi:hypothetical protein
MTEDLLILHLTYEFYNMIRSGEKTTEYREVKPYWTKRLKNKRKVLFVPGYGLCNSLDLVADISKIDIIEYMDLPDYVKQHFSQSKCKKFYAIQFKNLSLRR